MTDSENKLAWLLARTVLTDDSGCLIWAGIPKADGYACTTWRGQFWVVHRLAWTLQRGPVPDGMQLDHVCHSLDDTCVGGPSCRHRACLNVNHLEVVTGHENTLRSYRARRPRCINGHPFDEANTYWRVSGGGRSCRACGRHRAAAYKIRKQMRAAGIAA